MIWQLGIFILQTLHHLFALLRNFCPEILYFLAVIALNCGASGSPDLCVL